MNLISILLIIVLLGIIALIFTHSRYKKKLHETSALLAQNILDILEETGVKFSEEMTTFHSKKLQSVIEMCTPNYQWVTDMDFFVKGKYQEVKPLIEGDPKVEDLKRTIESIKRFPRGEVKEDNGIYMLELTKKQAIILYYTLKKIKKPTKPIRYILSRLRTIKNS